MFTDMSRRLASLRIAIALVATLVVVVAGPVHAAHHHGDTLHAACAVCQLHSPACPTVLAPCADISLQPIFTLADASTRTPDSAPAPLVGTRAPPSLVA